MPLKVAGIELQSIAGHKMSYQQSEKQSLSRADPKPLSTGWLLGQIKSNFSLGPFLTMVAGGSPKAVALAQPHLLQRSGPKLAFTTSTGVTVRLARPAWLPRQAKLPLHCGWQWTWQMYHWPWSVKSTIRKAKLPKHNTKLDCIVKTGGYLQLRSFTFFALHNIYSGPFRQW